MESSSFYWWLLLSLFGLAHGAAAQVDPLEKERLLHQWNSGGHWEVAGLLGVANYQGDLAEDIIEFRETKVAGGLLVRYHFNKSLALRASVLSGQISGTDANSARLAPRGWRFNAILSELALGAEYCILPRSRFNNAGVFVPHFSPYLFVGIGLGLSRINLRGPTEREPAFAPFPRLGDTRRYGALPFGAGLRLDLTENLVLGAEIGTRYTFTDGLDGVATLNRRRNDWYLLVGGTLGYYLSRHRQGGGTRPRE